MPDGQAGSAPAGRRLVFVNHAADAGAPAADTDHVVLDAAWTPGPGERRDLIPVRPALWEVFRERNLHHEALAAMDDWATRADLIDRFDVDGVSWWYHVRSFLQLDLHELLLWRHLLDRLAPPGSYERFDVPSDRPHLRSALEAERTARAVAPEVNVADAITAARSFGGGKPSKAPSRTRPWYRRLISRTLRTSRRTVNVPARVRARLLRRRLGRLIHQRPEVLAIVRGESYHLVRGSDGEERFDPIVTPVLRLLAARGLTTAIVVLGTTPDEEAAQLLREDGPMPIGILTNLLIDRSERVDDREDLARRLAGIEAVPLAVAGVDIAPPLVEILRGLDRWFSRQRRERLVAERVMATLRPSVMLTGWEAARTAWLGAARARGVPSVAIQHGVIYEDNPDYYRPVRPNLVRPNLTCTFGEFERRLLVEECGYPPASVIATGSPRTAPDVMDLPPLDPLVRAEVRASLAVADRDRMLVLSASRHALGEGLTSMTNFGRLLDGPLPGVHLVVKLHPEEERGDHYEELIGGLAAGGGFEPPPVTVVRDIDLTTLLRAADAHLGIYSTVLTDAVVAGTPNMVAVGQAWADLLGYVAAGVAEPVASVDDVRAFMAEPRPPAPEARANFVREHGKPGDGAERIADAVAAYADRARRQSGATLTGSTHGKAMSAGPGGEPARRSGGF